MGSIPITRSKRKIAFIAQSVERIHGKDEVIGSIPIKGSKRKSPEHQRSGLFLFYSGCKDAVMVVAVL